MSKQSDFGEGVSFMLFACLYALGVFILGWWVAHDSIIDKLTLCSQYAVNINACSVLHDWGIKHPLGGV